MRLAFVSAHYPPNFTSGGTLVPKRLAEGLAARGHDVSVFAGHLGPDPAGALRVWDDTDGAVPVRWIDITPFTSWEDPHNTDNPPVTAAFATFLDERDPEVVHLHSLQTLGAPLVSAAADHGAATVVTMHDFWWICARQFLVDRDLVPCSPVVAAGVCACQQGRDSLVRRTEALAVHLRRADLVVVPSAPMGAILVANGIPASQVRVEENGVPWLPEPVGRGSAGPSVVRCIGGADAMKGAGVLAEAVRLLGPRADAAFVAHGDAARWAEWLEPGHALEVRPPFPPEELGDVLASTDVLVVPSLARESFSLTIREAMAAGVAVISSDSPGASGVIDHDRSGLLVPTGDPVALAGAVASLLADPERRGRLADTATSVAVRSVEEHVEAVEALSESVAGGRRTTPTTARPAIERVAYVVGIDGAPLRYRAHLPAEALGVRDVSATVHHYLDPSAPDAARCADVVVLYRVPATVQVLALMDELRGAGVPLVFDVDDLIFDPDVLDDLPGLATLPTDEQALYRHGVDRYRTTLEHADFFTGSTPVLVEAARRCTGVDGSVVPNGVGLSLAQRSDAALRRARRPGPLRVGYFSGTTTHDADWAEVAEAVVDAVAAHPDAVLVLGGHLRAGPAVGRLGERVRVAPFVDWTDLPGQLRDLDVNLAPLQSGLVFNEAKSAIKWLEAALCATPTVASPTGPFRAAVDHGRTGLLAAGPDEWREAVSTLLDDDALRATIGGRARTAALVGWAPHRQADAVLAALSRARSAERRSSWADVAPDEPPSAVPVVLSTYPPPTSPPEAAPVAPRPESPPAAERLPPLPRRAWNSLRADGVGPTWQRVRARLRRGIDELRDGDGGGRRCS